MIAVGFEGDISKKSMVFTLMGIDNVEIVSEEDRQFTYRQFLPEEPPEIGHFKAWVFQSINRAADVMYSGLAREVSFANSLGHSYLTESQFTANLLNFHLDKPSDVRTDVANLTLDLRLPIVDKVSVEKLMEVRYYDGESFGNFRMELEKRLKTLRSIDDEQELRRELQDVAHEMNEAEVFKVKQKMRQLRREALGDAVIFLASLGVTIQSGGLTTLAAIAAGAKGVKTVQDYFSTVKDNPMYFLWRLEKS